MNTIKSNPQSSNIIPISVIAERLRFTPSKNQFNENSYLEVELIPASELKVATDIQRLVIKSMIKGAKQFSGKLARPLYVFKRPNGDLVVTDGQHTAIMGILYTTQGSDVLLPCQIDVHPKDFSDEECAKAEAQKFKELNSRRRQAAK